MALATLTARADEQAPDPFFSQSNLEYVKKSVQELRTGKGTAHELIEVEDE